MISPEAVGPPDQGFRIRVHHHVRGLAAADFDVTLLAAASADATSATGLDGVRIVTVPVGSSARERGTARRLAELASGYRTNSLHARIPGIRPVARSLIAEGGFDAIQVELPGLVDVVGNRRPVVYDAHNIWSELVSRAARARRSPARRLLGRIRARAIRSVEVGAWKRSDLSLATSPREADLIRTHTTRPVEVIPNGVDLVAFRSERPLDRRPDPEIVFVGLLSYGPNAQAVRELIEDILPSVERSVPGVAMTIVGDGAPSWLTALARGNVTFTGHVPDVRPFLEQASAVAVPLRAGSGTRIKILEALAMSRPVVTTTLGGEGLELTDGRHALITDDPGDIARALIRVIHDPSLAATLAREGRALVERSYGWEAIGRDLVAAYQRLLADHHP